MMPETSATPNAPPQSNWPKMLALLRPHWKTLTIALLAVLVETSADLLEPWPLKIIVDNLLQSKPLPHWLAGVVSHMAGHDKLAILNFAVLAVAVIASHRRDRLLHRKVPHHQRRPMGDARHAADALPAHPSPVSGGARRKKNRRSDQPRHQRHRSHSGLHHFRAARHAGQRAHAGGHGGRDVLHQLALHADRPLHRAGAFRCGVFLHQAHQENLARSAPEAGRAAHHRSGSVLFHSRREGVSRARTTSSSASKSRAWRTSKPPCTRAPSRPSYRPSSTCWRPSEPAWCWDTEAAWRWPASSTPAC